MTFKVSTFSGFVTKGHQTMQCVSSSPSKIPYVGFSPGPASNRNSTGTFVRPPELKHRACIPSEYPDLYPITVQFLFFYSPSGQVCRRSDTEQSSPEALGSPAGYVVRPDLSLLWPHPKLSIHPIDLWIIRWGFALRPGMGWYREAPQFTLYILSHRAASCTPVDREGAFDCSFPSRSSLRHLCTGSASTTPCPPVLAWEA